MTNTEKGRLLWCDAEANCRRLSTREGVADIAGKARRANITTLIVDVKPLVGEVLYNSRYAPRFGEVDGFSYPEDFDLLQAMIEEGHSRGLRVHAAINVFSEGCRQWNRGPAYEHPEWQVVHHEGVRQVSLGGGPSYRVRYMDPWDLPGHEPVIHTRKSGRTLKPASGRVYNVIEGHSVSSVLRGEDVPIPENGCVLSVSDLDIKNRISPGDPVEFSVQSVFRRAQDSLTPSWGLFVNPIGPARQHELDIVREIVSGYDIDGITLDRMRYPSLYGDFSEESREAFSEWLGAGELRWPEDVFVLNARPWLPPVPGRYYREWLEWRAWNIRGFAEEAVGLVRSLNDRVKIGVYVGSWYESYYDVGVNWGSAEYHPGYSWMTPQYNRTGYAELFDYICTGCYYPVATRAEAREVGHPEGATVEAACDISTTAAGGACAVYGSLYLREFAGDPESFRKSVRTSESASKGVMLFDLVYLEDYGWWPILEELFVEKSIAPHDIGVDGV